MPQTFGKTEMNLNPKHMRRLFAAIEVNFVLWGAAAGHRWYHAISKDFSFVDEEEKLMIWIVSLGFFLSALLQHWCYYNIYKPAKRGMNQKTEPADASKHSTHVTPAADAPVAPRSDAR